MSEPTRCPAWSDGVHCFTNSGVLIGAVQNKRCDCGLRVVRASTPPTAPPETPGAAPGNGGGTRERAHVLLGTDRFCGVNHARETCDLITASLEASDRELLEQCAITSRVADERGTAILRAETAEAALARARELLGRWMYWASGVVAKSLYGEQCIADTDAFLASRPAAATLQTKEVK